jgi:ribose transport system permease protein
MSALSSAPAPGGPPAARTEALSPSRRRAADLISRTALVWLWLIMIVVYAILDSSFLQAGTFQTIFGSQVELVFLAMGLICVFVVGEFDLSVASIMGLSATIVPLLSVRYGWDVTLATFVALAAALAVGAINGFLVVVVGVDAIVATLGMATFILGITLAITNLEAISGLSASYSQLALRDVFGLPISVYYGIVAGLVLAYVLTSTPLGLRMSFVGSNREVARLAGLNVNRIRFGAYMASALFCGIAGVIVTATLGGYDPNTSAAYLRPAFAAVFLGTAVIMPGRFNPVGTLIGVWFLQTGIVGLQIMGLTGWISSVFYGGTLVLAVAITTVIQRHARR